MCVYPKLLSHEKVGLSLAEVHLMGGVMQHGDSIICYIITINIIILLFNVSNIGLH